MKQTRNLTIAFGLLIWQCGVLPSGIVNAQTKTAFQIKKDVPYKIDVDGYESERCKLDIYTPNQGSNLPSLVWFHGGGLTGGDKKDKNAKVIAEVLAEKNVIVVMVNYRLSPKAKYPAYIEDAAASVAWATRNIDQYNGDPKKVFVGGHSAGAYLTMMLGLDEKHLAAEQTKLSDIAGWIPVSAQVDSHWTVRAERGIDRNTQVIDESAPLFHIRKDTPKMLVVVAENDLKGRAALNKKFVEKMKSKGHKDIPFHTIKDRDHGSLISKINSPNDTNARLIGEFIGK